MPIGSVIQGVKMAGGAAAAAGILSGVGAAGAAGWGLTGAIGNIIQNYQNRQLNERILKWNQAVQAKEWEREDTAVQRRAADLQAAGINPMLAGLGGATTQSGQIINPTQPGFGDVSAAVQGFNSMADSGAQIYNAYNEEMNRKLDAAKLETDKYDAETRRIQAENTNNYNMLKNELENEKLDEETRHNKEQEKQLYDELNNRMNEFAEQIAVQKRQAKTAEARQTLDEINSEAQRKLTSIQALAVNNNISNDEKRVKMEQELHEWQRVDKGYERADKAVSTGMKIFNGLKDGLLGLLPWRGKK